MLAYPFKINTTPFDIGTQAPGFNIFIVDATASAISIDLPSIANTSGINFSFSRIDTSTNTVTINGNGANINGSPSQTMPAGINAVITSQNAVWNITGGTLGSPIGTGVLPVVNGGTGVTALTSGNVLVGTGTTPVDTTKAAPTGAFVGTTDNQSLTSKNITGSTNVVEATGLRNGSSWTRNIAGTATPSLWQILYCNGPAVVFGGGKYFATVNSQSNINNASPVNLFNLTAAVGSLNIPTGDNMFRLGSICRINITGVFSINAGSTITILMTVGATTYTGSYTNNDAANIPVHSFSLQAWVSFSGVSPTLLWFGNWIFQSSGTTAAGINGISFGSTSSSLGSTGFVTPLNFTMTGQFSVASPTNQLISLNGNCYLE